MILSYSCSGSSKHIADVIAENYEEDAICINEGVKNGVWGDFYSDVPFIIICPIFNMRIPHNVYEYLKNSRFEGSDEIVFMGVCSYSAGNARGYVNTLFKQKGKRCIFTAIIMPSTNVFARSKMSEKQKENVVKRAEVEALKIAHLTYSAAPIAQTAVSLVGVIGSALNPYIVKTLTDKKIVVNENCTKCGKCGEVCTMNNIVVEEDGVKFLHHCNHCSACINNCPENAIIVKKAIK